MCVRVRVWALEHRCVYVTMCPGSMLSLENMFTLQCEILESSADSDTQVYTLK